MVWKSTRDLPFWYGRHWGKWKKIKKLVNLGYKEVAKNGFKINEEGFFKI